MRIFLHKKYLQNHGILVTKFTTCRTILHYASIMLNEQLSMFFSYFYCFQVKVIHYKKEGWNVTPLHKTSVQWILQEHVFTLSMVRVFINVWLKLVVLNFTEIFVIKKQGKEWKETQLQYLNIFNIWFKILLISLLILTTIPLGLR